MHGRSRVCRCDRHVGEPPFPPSFSDQRRWGVSPDVGREGTGQDDSAKDLEILVLRHQLRVLQRTASAGWNARWAHPQVARGGHVIESVSDPHATTHVFAWLPVVVDSSMIPVIRLHEIEGTPSNESGATSVQSVELGNRRCHVNSQGWEGDGTGPARRVHPGRRKPTGAGLAVGYGLFKHAGEELFKLQGQSRHRSPSRCRGRPPPSESRCHLFFR